MCHNGGFMSDETELLRREIAQLREQIEAVDDWANGLLLALVQVLPHLLRGHPEAGKVQRLLQACDERFEELRLHPERSQESADTAALLEASKMLHRQLAALNTWPAPRPPAG